MTAPRGPHARMQRLQIQIWRNFSFDCIGLVIAAIHFVKVTDQYLTLGLADFEDV